jgi:heme/copper-type cytochrome/quinol oxidase subunit 4
MADAHHGNGHHGPKVQTYIVIGLALAIFTIVSFVVNGAVRSKPPILTHDQGFWIILAVAIVKASLVVFYFMHLIWDWKKVAFMIAPVLILGTMMIVILMPDIVLAWKQPEATAASESRADDQGHKDK